MKTFVALLCVHGRRAVGRPGYVVMSGLLTAAAIVAAVWMGGKADGLAAVAYVPGTAGSDGPPPAALQQAFRVETLAEAPPVSALLRRRYEAIVSEDGSGGYDVVSIRGEEFRARLAQGLGRVPDTLPADVPKAPRSRDVGVVVVGYLVMFVLMSGSAFMNFFTDDKVGGTLRRTATAPVGLGRYLAGLLAFNSLMLFVPALAVLIVLRGLFGLDIGFTFGQYGLLLGLLTSLATAFGFFVAAAVESADDAMAVSGSVIVVTSLLGGTFFPFAPEGGWLGALTAALPQRHVMAVAEAFAVGAPAARWAGEAAWVAAVAVLFVAAGWSLCRARFRGGRY